MRGEEMARIRSDKGKSKPLHKPVDRKESKKEIIRPGQSDEGTPISAQPTGRGMSENPASSQPAAKIKKRQVQQRVQAPSTDLGESEAVSSQAPFTTITTAANGYRSTEDDPATHRRIAERAYILFLENGCEHGNDWSHWFEAERLIKSRG